MRMISQRESTRSTCSARGLLLRSENSWDTYDQDWYWTTSRLPCWRNNNWYRKKRELARFFLCIQSNQSFVGRTDCSGNQDTNLTGCQCGERGIRTLEELSPLTVFKTAAFNHSAISPVHSIVTSPGFCTR